MTQQELTRLNYMTAVAERKLQEGMERITNAIAEEYAAGRARIVAVSGPTSSGKTTFSGLLCRELCRAGFDAVQISMDDYFIDRVLSPRDADGNYDFESPVCVDSVLLSNQLNMLIAGSAVTLPLYDFISGTRKWHSEKTQLGERPVIVMEGIHALNPAIVPAVPRGVIFGVFVSVPDADIRLLRRIVRDSCQRGHSAEATICMWESVRRGEERHINPFRENASAIFDSTVSYELGVLRTGAEPLLREIAPQSPAYATAQRLLTMLEGAEPISEQVVPEDSLLREFVCKP